MRRHLRHGHPASRQIEVLLSATEFFWLEFMEDEHLQQFVRLFFGGQQDSFEFALDTASRVVVN